MKLKQYLDERKTNKIWLAEHYMRFIKWVERLTFLFVNNNKL
jgi:hypothetical protein